MTSRSSILRSLGMVLTALAALAVGCSKEARVSQHLADADRHFQNREFEKAKIEYINVLREQPTNGLAVLRLGKIFLAQGQFTEAAPLVAWSRRRFPDDLEMRETFIEMLGAAGGVTNRIRLMREIDELLDLDPGNTRAVLALAAASRSPEEVAAVSQRLGTLRSKAGERPAFKLVEAELARRRGDTNACETLIRAAIDLSPTNLTSKATLAAFLLSQRRVPEGEAALREAAQMAPPYSPVRERWARYLLQAQRLDEARAVLDGITTQAPERVSAWAARAELAITESKWDEAEVLLSRALSQAPTHVETLRVKAQLLVARGKPDEAIRELEKILQQEPRSARSQFQLAVAHLINKDTVSATAALEESVQNEPGFAEAVLLLSELNLARGQGENARQALRNLIQRNPDNQRAFLQLIRTERALGHGDDAVTVAKLGQERFPTNAAMPLQLGLILRQAKRPEEARAAFERTLQVAPDDLAAFEQLVLLDVEKKDYAAASGRVQARLDRSPKEPLIWLVKSEVHRAQGDVAQCEAALREVLALDPANVPALMTLARLALASGKKQEAQTRLEEILRHRPQDLVALQTLGILRAELGDDAGAREAYRKMLAVRPDHPVALNNLAELLNERFDEFEEARGLALRARQAIPTDPLIADTLGWIEYRRGQYAEALRLLSESAAKLGDNPQVQYHLGMAYYMTGQEAPARTALQRAVAAPAAFPGQAVAREYLAMLEVDGGKVDEAAIRALERRRQEAPGDIVALARLGTAYAQTGETDKARDAYEAALKLNPQSVPVLGNLARLYAGRLGNPARALELARTARSQAPEDPAVALNLGRIAFDAGDHAWAYSLLQESTRRLTNRWEAPYALAWAAFGIGRLEEAVRGMKTVAASGAAGDLVEAATTFLEMVQLATNTAPTAADAARIQKVLDTSPDHGAALFARGRTAEVQGRDVEARTAYERLLERFPGCTPAVRQLAVLYSERLSEDAKAEKLGVKAREAFPRDEVLAAALGKAAARRGDFGYAVQLLTEASRTRTKDASLFYHLGMAQEGLKKPAEAQAQFTKALELEPQAPFAEDARKRLDKLKANR